MKESSLSPAARALLDAAKSDGPRVAARAKMWGAVSTATGTGIAIAAKGGAAAAGGSAAVAAASSGKLLAAGALFGSALTVGITVAVVRILSGGGVLPSAKAEAPVAAEARPSTPGGRGERREARGIEEAEPDPRGSDLESSRVAPPPVPLSFNTVAPPSAASPRRASSGATGVRVSAEDPLDREGALIMEARGALNRKDPEAALVSIDAARRVGSHILEPEELKVRSKTLRALGRDAEADEAWALLKARYPDQAR